MRGVFGATPSFGILADHKTNGIPHSRSFVVFSKVVAVQKNFALPDLKESITFYVIPFDDFGS